MRANLAQQEPLTLKRWKKQALYHSLQEQAQNAPLFSFHDGPPYANGDIHLGHLLNKVLKDFVVRSQLLMGKRCPFTPGWDCHGLPIEHKVMTQLQAEKSPVLGLSIAEQRVAIRKACQNYAKSQIKTQAKQMQSLLTLADYDRPYLSMSKVFESRTLEVFAQLFKEGLVYRQLKPVHWSLENQTALAEAELEYQDKEDSAVYVAFDLKSTDKLAKFSSSPSTGLTSLVIWTTTPWTLPANLAVAVHERSTYILVQDEKRVLIMAEDRYAAVCEKLGKAKLAIIGKCKGSDLVGLAYKHPFCEGERQVFAAEFVTMEDGSGLVHIAPGHGQDDYQLGQTHGLDVYCPVLGNGCYDERVPEWLQGMHIWKANPVIVDKLQASGHLLQHERFMHSYPHDWRSKTPVIFRSTEQWFIGVDKPLNSGGGSLRELALKAINDDIHFYPDWGKKRLHGMLESRPDWCISRQRSWGLPIPAFKHDERMFMTEASIKAVSQVFTEEGSDAWFRCDASSLLRHYDPSQDTDCPANLDISSLEPCFDIFDVWFESGSSFYSVLGATGQDYPADLYLEGSDQHRGWFHLSLLNGLAMLKKAPYKALLTHGFIVDKAGKKMSKSGGNALAVQDLLQKYGAEVTRCWVAGLKFEGDIKVDLDYFDVAADQYRKIRNTLRFLLSNLSGFDFRFEPDAKAGQDSDLATFTAALDPTSLDAWLLKAFTDLQIAVKTAFAGFQFKEAFRLLNQFCQDTLSAQYCRAVKDRLYCDETNSDRRVQCQKSMLIVFTGLCKLLSVVLPHTCDEAYRVLMGDDASIHLFPDFEVTCVADAAWDNVFEQRELVLKALEDAKEQGLENPLDAGVALSDPEQKLTPFIADLADIFGVSRVRLDADSLTLDDLRNEPRCERSWKRDDSVKAYADGSYLSERDAKAVGILVKS
eukprot:COSAG01_NODE_6_length_54687_cov_500.907599_34_plen_926_part_00